ncbi:MAG: hypothetical protein A3C30_04460 [Candidatus Levybacteria bacterium RIFCSPHIGHO2_02_FULL_40_18]|nr:MAG: hypothetical protein A2869_01550 [Candidatus Levybacteria bacterium RIFCSPHIGHO2_01_FULL_40_58]OGH26333.1 MAG: hypothetical protein A3C30_04460 [Candidatus Levybacteria bacterium RIFCSPHIGHO2_02_FULL_40_18]OGH31292.1 MAG: hypothetical protein A3E43_02715 [Candidatus Levybacteria bacterium RIFCSPHIGHO2_12_FULL_40_31]OGH40794.1 MAG: hypothetical protein A2894_02150 [Candidatus Levybacteria bacterium RIFCSPLOWO2_01_FULL_40_64]OGH49212.1 MAG: hypothetical protein A3I54_01015 [Candidatus Lev
MKEVLLFSALLFLLTPKVSAEIIEGKSTVNTSVTTNVNSSSNNSNDTSETKTHIEIEVNGEKKVLDTSEPGTHTLSIENEGGKSSATVRINSSSDSSNDEDTSTSGDQNDDADEGPEAFLDDDAVMNETGELIKEVKEEQKNVVEKILDSITNFFEKLFNF